jgi:hypothetical protein
VERQYEIVVRGRFTAALTKGFDAVEVESAEPGTTLLSGWFLDQSALQGILSHLADLGIDLLELRCVADGSEPRVDGVRPDRPPVSGAP